MKLLYVPFVLLLFIHSSLVRAQNFTLSTQVINAPCGLCEGKIDLTVTGGSANLLYQWSNNATTEDLSGLCEGTYTVTVSSANGVSKTTSATVVSQQGGIELSVCVTDVLCNGSQNGAVDLSVLSGTAPFTYQWSNGATSQDLSGLSAGTYIPTVTDATGCTSTTIAVVGTPDAISLNATTTSNSIDLDVAGGTSPYSYSWSNGATSQDLVGLSAGTYCVTVVDDNGCSRNQCFTVQGGGNANPILINGVVTNTGCGLPCTGSIILNITGSSGTSGYSYLWSTGTTTQNLTGLCGGTYCVSVTGLNVNTFVTQCFTVKEGQSESVEIQSTNAAFCNIGAGNDLCEQVCPGSPVTYFIETPVICGSSPSLQGVEWIVSGAKSYSVSQNGLEVNVEWGSSGPGLVQVSFSSPDFCFESSRCVTIVDEPVAQFSSLPSAQNGTLQVCKGQTVYFENLSIYSDLYDWIFSDDLSSFSTENTQHTFNSPGNYTVTLIAKSSCLCSDTTVMMVEVLDSEPPVLDCVGAICPGETATYTTSSSCASYVWQVSPNGTVVNGGGSSDNNVSVIWNNGPAGTISLSAIGCSGAACPQASIFTIPVVSDDAEISGPQEVCKDNEESYSIQLFDGTQYNWSLSSGGSILSGQGTNQVVIGWNGSIDPSINHWLVVEYENCYLGCGGIDSIPVKILPPFLIEGAVELCEGTASTFRARWLSPDINVSANWIIFKSDGSVFWTSSSPSAVLNFPANAPAGSYRIYAEASQQGQTCSESAELTVNVIARPATPIAVAGAQLICPGNTYTYEVSGSAPYTVEWQATGGFPVSQTGDPVAVTWNATGPYSLSVKHVSVDGLGCASAPVTYNIGVPSTLVVTGPPSLCDNEVGTYSTALIEGLTYQWEVIPSSAGTISAGQGTNTVEIFWSEPGNHQVRVAACGYNAQRQVLVNANPEPVINGPEGLCAGISATYMSVQSYTSYAWTTADGSLLSSTAAVELTSGSYVLEVVDNNGCTGATDFSVDDLPPPNVSVTTANPTGFCNNGAFVTMTALVPQGGTFTYEWLQDGIPLGATGPTYTTNQYGLFTVVATNETGCSSTASGLLLYNYCNGGGGGYGSGSLGGATACNTGDLEIVIDPSERCDSVSFSIGVNAGQYNLPQTGWWTGISGGATIGTSTGETANFTYPDPGKYVVQAIVYLQGFGFCELIDSVDILAVADFSAIPGCPGDSTFFSDESTKLPQAEITGWEWNFGAAGTADTSTLSNPVYVYPVSGAFTASLTITEASGCYSTISRDIIIPIVQQPSFAAPQANCAGSATEFMLNNTTGILESVWNFGDPGSGAQNSSDGNPVFHNYASLGTYTVSVTTVNSYGCQASFSLPVPVVANPFSGEITPVSPTICEGQSVTLTAPGGPGAIYLWSNGFNSQTLIADQEGVYDVTVSNNNGCNYSPSGATVEVNPAPVGVIKALELNEIGQIIGVSFPTLSVCYGEDVNLQIQDNGDYAYLWSDGSTSSMIQFTETRGNLLEVGTHIYTVTVTNSQTGCTTVFDPFEVTVNPVPDGFTVAGDNLCAGEPTVLTYTGPQPANWQIVWNTGDTGPVLTTEEAGLYFVRVFNEFGCFAQSNSAVIYPGPNVAAIPAGCHERCNPDTLCLPDLPGIVGWQWYFEGNPIPGANTNDFIATQSGTYFAEMTDTLGCTARSGDLTLALFNGFGNVYGQVWSDVNHNGLIDAADTLVGQIPVNLVRNNTVLNTGISGSDGSFEWNQVPPTTYTVQLDTIILDSVWIPVIVSDTALLAGCGGSVFTDLLIDVAPCPALSSSLELLVCPGASALYDGELIPAGITRVFTLASIAGCDSLVTVTVNERLPTDSTLLVTICESDVYNYQGTNLATGESRTFTLVNYLGCDSLLTIVVSGLPVSEGALNPSVCQEEFFTYQGVDLSPGETRIFTLSNYLGCDSLVTVSVGILPAPSFTQFVQVCPGSVYTFQGVNISPGQTRTFTIPSTGGGCDSLLYIQVSEFQIPKDTLNAKVCLGSTYSYEGVELSVGDVRSFTLTGSLGCDSVVTVFVDAIPSASGTLDVTACAGDVYTYMGVNIPAGQSQNFNLTSVAGCDSTLRVNVVSLDTLYSFVQVVVCSGGTYNYNGTEIGPGQSVSFIYTASTGCDSVVQVLVQQAPPLSSTLNVRICPGSVYNYQGTNLVIGQSQVFQLETPDGCDSLVTVYVGAIQVFNTTLNAGVCLGQTFSYQGAELGVGQSQTFTLTSQSGCDSIVTVYVYGLSPTYGSVNAEICAGTVFTYQGVDMAAGETRNFILTNQAGCDSIVTVTVSGSNVFSETVNVRVCPGSFYNYQGVNLTVGQSQTFSEPTQSGCDSLVTILVTALPISTENLDVTICQGGYYAYQGVNIPAGQSKTFILTNYLGCDSILTISVTSLPPLASSFTVPVCQGKFYSYQGVQIGAGQTRKFTLTSQNGCDSVVTVTATTLPVSYSELNAQVCPGKLFNYQGVNMTIGQMYTFTLTNYRGCDSLVTVSVSALPPVTSSFEAQVCQGQVFVYEGVSLGIGQSQTFPLKTAQGCDSLVTVSVTALPVSFGNLNVAVCEGGSYQYQGVNMAPGETRNFTLTNYLGCDSVVTVTVNAIPPPTTSFNARVCAGGFYVYEGVSLAVGQTQSFVLKTAAGCDSIVTVTVSSLPITYGSINPQICQGGFYSYQGTTIAAGQTRTFTLTNYLGCDSILTVSVTALQPVSSSQTVKVCTGETYLYEGIDLSIGQSQSFTLSTPTGCDSVVTITVGELQASQSTLNISICENETYNFNGNNLLPNTVNVFTIQNWQGCDSVITVNVGSRKTSQSTLNVQICKGESFDYFGTEIQIGETKTVILQNNEGCDSTVTVTVSGYPELEFDLFTRKSCSNTGSGSIRVDIEGTVMASGYSINGGVFQTDSLFGNLAPGLYSIVIVDEYGCIYNAEAGIQETQPLRVDLPDAVLVPCDSQSITLFPFLAGDTSGLELVWWNGTNGKTATADEPGRVWLSATNDCGQNVLATSEIELADDAGNPLRVYVPNVFAPESSDPDNSLFRAFFGSNFTILSYRMEIYDRWGNLMFVTTDLGEGWEGFFNDEPMNPGVYVWQLWADLQICSRTIPVYRKGDVTIVR